MTEQLRFIHAADVHLGAPVRGLRDVSPEWAARLQRAIAEAFERVIDAAIDRRVDFVVLAGDAFDTSRASYGDYLRFFEGLERLDEAGIPAYLVTGNHDPFTAWTHDVGRLSASARLLGVGGPEFALFRREDRPICLLGARSYYTQTWPADQSIAQGISRDAAVKALVPTQSDAAQAPFAVGIVHTGLDIDAKKAPADQEKLLAAGMDYWACGHLHKRLVRPTDSSPRIVFPGCIQGRDIKETGERGCYLVELEMGQEFSSRIANGTRELNSCPILRSRVSLEFVPTSSVVLQQLRVDVSACQTLADIVRLVQARLFHENGQVHCDEMVSRITLEGSTDLHEFLVKPEVVTDLRNHINNAYPSFFCDALVDQTRPVGRRSQVTDRAAGPFTAIVQDMAAEQRARPDVLVNYAQAELVKRGIAVPDSLVRRIGAFNDAAEVLVGDLLDGGDE